MIVSGGNSLIQGFTERLTRDLSIKTPPVSFVSVIGSTIIDLFMFYLVWVIVGSVRDLALDQKILGSSPGYACLSSSPSS